MNSRDYLLSLFLVSMLVFLVFNSAAAGENLDQDVLFFSEDFSGENVDRFIGR